ncbi:hypothetical protein GGX14DRAFT_392430 [Mycena pura]|uniref:Uncharacterized protein n=1 Tax=Mycena pura TaxID=153505 RepID=A0AAD6VIX2_9AGAR|nr:hypothetical protein GGX14DRAFT_392430 [Mycena pura]
MLNNSLDESDLSGSDDDNVKLGLKTHGHTTHVVVPAESINSSGVGLSGQAQGPWEVITQIHVQSHQVASYQNDYVTKQSCDKSMGVSNHADLSARLRINPANSHSPAEGKMRLGGIKMGLRHQSGTQATPSKWDSGIKSGTQAAPSKWDSGRSKWDSGIKVGQSKWDSGPYQNGTQGDQNGTWGDQNGTQASKRNRAALVPVVLRHSAVAIAPHKASAAARKPFPSPRLPETVTRMFPAGDPPQSGSVRGRTQ